MNDLQEKLFPYVLAKTEEILERKRAEKILPELVTEMELMGGIRTDIRECMRELHRQEFYQATRTINLAALKPI